MNHVGSRALGWLAVAAAIAVAGYAGWSIRDRQVLRRAAALPAPGERPQPTPGAERQGLTPWWNRADVVETLGLSAEQRERIDRLFEAYRAMPKRVERRGELSTRLTEALRDAAWDEARAVLASMTDGYTRAESERLEATIATLQVLDAQQRRLVREHYPRLYQGAWLRTEPWRGPRSGDARTLPGR